MNIRGRRGTYAFCSIFLGCTLGFGAIEGCAAGDDTAPGGGAETISTARAALAVSIDNGCPGASGGSGGGTAQALVCHPGDVCYEPGGLTAGSGGMMWCSSTVGTGWAAPDASASYDNGIFSVKSNGTGIAAYPDFNPDVDWGDSVRYVYTQWQGLSGCGTGSREACTDVEMVVHVHSVDSVWNYPMQVGVMLRDGGPNAEVNPSMSPPVAPGGARMAAFGLTANQGGCGEDPRLTDTVVKDENTLFAAYRPIALQHYPFTQDEFWSTEINYANTRFAPPDVWLRLQRVGGDVAGAASRDGGFTWIPVGPMGNRFVVPSGADGASTKPLVGFFAALRGMGMPPGTSATVGKVATFDVTYLGPPRLNHASTWIGSSSARASLGVVTLGGSSFYAAGDGQTYKAATTNETNLIANIFPAAGVGSLTTASPVRAFGGAYGVGRGGLAGDSSSVYLALTDLTRFWISRRDPASGKELSSYPTATCGLVGAASPIGQIGGLAARANGSSYQVFVSDMTSHTVHVLDWPTGGCPSESAVITQATGGFVDPGPGPLAIDTAGRLWVIQPSTFPPDVGAAPESVRPLCNGTPCYPASIKCFSGAAWAACPGYTGITTSIANPVAIAAARTSPQILIADAGPNQNVLVCDTSPTVPTCSTTLGQTGGVFGTNPGLVTSGTTIRLSSPMGVGFSGTSAPEAFYVADNAPAFGIHKVDATGVPDASYKPPYGLGEEPGAFDPLSTGDYYTLTRHLTFDALQTAPGTEWALKAITYDPFNHPQAEMVTRCPLSTLGCNVDGGSDTYAEPPKSWALAGVGNGRHTDVRIAHTVAKESPILRHLSPNPGRDPSSADPLFVYVPYSIGYYRHLAIFRFEGELAIPVASLEFQPPAVAGSPPNVRLWTDTPTNPDGVRTASEDTSANLSLPGNPTNLEVDTTGNIWVQIATTTSLPSAFWKFKLTGLAQSAVGGVTRFVPQYSFDPTARVTFPFPTAIPTPRGMRVVSNFSHTGDTLYLLGLGSTVDAVCGFPNNIVLGGYDVSSQTNLSTPPPTRFERNLPPPGVGTPDDYSHPFIDPECTYCWCAGKNPPDPSCTCGQVVMCPRDSPDAICACAQSPQPAGCQCAADHDWEFNSLSVAGSYIFAGEHPGRIHVMRTSDGTDVTHLFEGPEVSGLTDYTSDFVESVKAVVRPSGEYLVTRRDVSPLARTSVFRWTPPTTFSPISLGPTAWYLATQGDMDLYNGTVSRWIDHSGHGHDLTVQNPIGWPAFNATGWAGHPTVTFNGTSNLLMTPWSGDPEGMDLPTTVLAVVRSAAVQDATPVGWWNNATNQGFRCAVQPASTSTLPVLGRDGDWAHQSFSPSIDLGTTGHVLAWRYARVQTAQGPADQFTITVDGTNYQDTRLNESGPLDFTDLVIGARNGLPTGIFKGDISEVVVVPSALSDTDVQSFRQYAKAQWGGLP